MQGPARYPFSLTSASSTLAGPQEITLDTWYSEGPDHPQRSASACVVVINGPGLGLRRDISEHGLVVGRGRESDLCIDHMSVSRRHCRLWAEAGRCHLQDLGATNPTRLNEHPVDSAALSDGDQILVGESILKFVGAGSVESAYHEALYRLATHDMLSGLYNRRHFIEAAQREIARSLRHGTPLALGIVDVDWFKAINDEHGHLAGDEVLRRIGAVIAAHMRGGDMAARIGGEEFGLLLPGCDAEAAGIMAERLRAAMADTRFELRGEAVPITVSIGLALLAHQHNGLSDLMTQADRALYRAKEQGRNRVCL